MNGKYFEVISINSKGILLGMGVRNSIQNHKIRCEFIHYSYLQEEWVLEKDKGQI